MLSKILGTGMGRNRGFQVTKDFDTDNVRRNTVIAGFFFSAELSCAVKYSYFIWCTFCACQLLTYFKVLCWAEDNIFFFWRVHSLYQTAEMCKEYKSLFLIYIYIPYSIFIRMGFKVLLQCLPAGIYVQYHMPTSSDMQRNKKLKKDPVFIGYFIGL
jgi:hypothetical protein